jgi:hypothetical protein
MGRKYFNIYFQGNWPIMLEIDIYRAESRTFPCARPYSVVTTKIVFLCRRSSYLYLILYSVTLLLISRHITVVFGASLEP